jgi:sugar porter (SP) family MFS transporter
MYQGNVRARSPLGHRRGTASAALPGESNDGNTFDNPNEDALLRTSLDIERSSLLPQPDNQPRGINTKFTNSTNAPKPSPEHSEPIDWVMTSFLFLFPALGGLLFGYDIGASSGALLSMTSSTFSGTDWYALSSFQSGLVVSLSLGGALLGSGGALIYGDSLGRRKELLLASVLYTIGALSVSIAPSLPAVLTGRLIYGVGIGFAMHAAPAYIAETSPARVRGLLISLKEAFIVGGILVGYAFGYVFVEKIGGWRFMYGAAAPLAGVLAAGMAWLPESPRWLLLSGNGASAAARAMERTKGKYADSMAVQVEIDEIEAAILASPTAQQQQQSSSSSSAFSAGVEALSVVLRPQYRRPLTVGVSLMLFQQITGQPSVLYYAAKIFQDAGFASAGQATGISVVLGFFKLLMTGIAVATVDSWGRRPLLLTGITGICGSLVLLGANQAGFLPVAESSAAWINVVALLAYVGAYQMSFGPISWLLVGEVFPLRVRGQAIALATLTNFASNFLVSLILPSLQEAYGPAAMYFVFAGIGVVALVTINNIVPETKGRSLEEIEKLWGPPSSVTSGDVVELADEHRE